MIFLVNTGCKNIYIMVTFDNNIDSNKFSDAHLYWTVLTAIVSNFFYNKKMFYYRHHSTLI